MADTNSRPPPWLVNFATLIILIGFSMAIIVSSYSGDWHPVEVLTPSVLITLGFLFGIRISKGSKDDP